jgi:hypothetical protein
MLVLRPLGRGNWSPVRIMIDETRNAPKPLFFRKGERVELGGIKFRVVRVHA